MYRISVVRYYIVGALLIAGFVAWGVMEMLNAQTPYVTTVAEVRAAGKRPVQFMGSIVAGATKYDEAADELVFRLKDDKGAALTVHYKGVKPEISTARPRPSCAVPARAMSSPPTSYS